MPVAVGTFLTHDPARQFASPYVYGPWDPVNGTDPTGAAFGLEALIAWAVVLLAAAVAIDVGVRTGDVGAALKAGALTFVSGVATAVGAYAGLGVLAAHVSASTMAIVNNVLAVAGLASGAYGAVEAGRNGMYASAAVGALLLAAGAYRLLARGAVQGDGRGGAASEGSAQGRNQPVGLGSGDAKGEVDVIRVEHRRRVPRHSENVEGLDPRFQAKVEAVMLYLEDRGYEPYVPKGSGLRSAAEQAAKARAGYSKISSGGPHQFGMAADIVDIRWGWGEFSESPWLGTPAYENYWAHLRVAAEAQGLRWGGNFGKLGRYNLGWDPAHVEMPDWRKLVVYH